MRRCLIVLAGVALFLTALAGPVTAAARPGCATSAAAAYRHTFTGPAGAATVAAVVPLCAGQSQAFSLVSYTVGGGAQFVYASDHAMIDANHRSVTLEVAVPGCATRVDAIFGRAVLTEVAGASTGYGTVRLGSASGIGHRSIGTAAWYSGGTSACAPRPSVTFVSACDGGFTATLANRKGATVTAVFTVGGDTYRVAPGARTTAVGDAGGSLTVRDNSFTTTAGTWSQPAVCVEPAPIATAIPAPPAATSAAPAVSPAAPPSSAPAPAPATVTPSPSGTVAVAGGTTFEPSRLVAAEPAVAGADLAVAGSSSRSIALIVLGVLLIGGGLVVLGRQIYRARQAG